MTAVMSDDRDTGKEMDQDMVGGKTGEGGRHRGREMQDGDHEER